MKERRKETEKRSGSAAGSAKRWKYSAVLSFLNTFVPSGNMESWDGDEQTAGYDHPEQREAAAGLLETGGVLTSEATHRKTILYYYISGEH